MPKNWQIYFIGRDDGIRKNLIRLANELQIGKNILAIHGLNSGLSSSDMLINAELSIGKRSGAEFAESAIKYDSPINLN